jgi:hypothetical protein
MTRSGTALARLEHTPDASATRPPGAAVATTDGSEAETSIVDRVREAIRATPATHRYADSLEIDVEDGRIVIRGDVDDIDDEDVVADVATRAARDRPIEMLTEVVLVELAAADHDR